MFNKNPWQQHPLCLAGKVDLIPTAWLYRYRCRRPLATTNLEVDNPVRVDLRGLLKNLQEEGMRDPFIIGAGVNTRTVRLEAGNHRIQLYLKLGIDLVPATVLVTEEGLTHPGNGLHRYPCDTLLLPPVPTLRPYEERRYYAPSAVFQDLQAYRAGVAD